MSAPASSFAARPGGLDGSTMAALVVRHDRCKPIARRRGHEKQAFLLGERGPAGSPPAAGRGAGRERSCGRGAPL